MGDLYVAKVLQRAECDGPPIELLSADYEFDRKEYATSEPGLMRAAKSLGLTVDRQTPFDECWAAVRSALQPLTPRQAGAAYKKASGFSERVAANLRETPTAIVRKDAVWVPSALLSTAVLHEAHPKFYPPVRGLRVLIEMISVHPDAGRPEHQRLTIFLTRLLSEAAPNGSAGSPIDKAVADLWTIAASTKLVVPLARCVCRHVLEFNAEFRVKHQGEWWTKHAPDGPSGNKPYEIAQYELFTYAGWLPEVRKGHFGSAAFE